MRLLIVLAAALASCTANAEPENITAEIWVDNWFKVYANGAAVLEDPVSITTERSFNGGSASFAAEFPVVIAIDARDFKENDTGLEYIGSRRQQMGDGGLIAQFKDAATGNVLAVTDSSTRCLVIHRAPLDRSCSNESNPVAGEGACTFEETPAPDNWTDAGFDDSEWPAATVHTAQQVRPHGGYDEFSWDPSAELIWGEDLEIDNTLLCRLTISDPG